MAKGRIPGLEDLAGVEFQGGQKPIAVTAIDDPEKFRRAGGQVEDDPVDELEGLEIQQTGGGKTFDVGVRFGETGDFIRPRTEAPQFEVTGIRRRSGETVDAFLRRQAKFDEVQQLKEKRGTALRRQARGKSAPAQGAIYGLADLAGVPEVGRTVETAITATAEGAGNVLGSAAEGLSLLSPEIKEELRRIGVVDDSMQPSFLRDQDAGTWTAKIFSGLGSSIPFGLITAISGGGGAAALGAASNAGTTYRDALDKGASEKDARAAAVVGGLVGSLEGALGVGKGGFLKPGVINGLIRYAKEAGEEGFQETLSQFLNNLNAKVLSGYDPKQALSEGLLENFAIGALVGGVFNAPGLVMGQVSEPVIDVDSIRDQIIGRAEAVKAAEAVETPASVLPSQGPIRLAALAEKADARPAMEVREIQGGSPELDAAIDSYLKENSLEGKPRFEPGPAETGGFVMVPAEMAEALNAAFGQGVPIGGLNVEVNDKKQPIESLFSTTFEAADPSTRDQQAEQQLYDAIANAKLEAEAKGLSTIQFVLNDPSLGDQFIQRIKNHESFHSGQQAVADFINKYPDVLRLGIEDIHAPTILQSDAFIKASNTLKAERINEYAGPQMLVAELAAYFAAGQEAEFGLRGDDAVDYLTDYLLSVVDKSGADGLDILSRKAQLTERMEALIGGLEYGQTIDISTLGAETPERPAAAAGGAGAYGGGVEGIAEPGAPRGRAALGPPDQGGGDQGGGPRGPVTLDQLAGVEGTIGAEPVFDDPLAPVQGGPPAPPSTEIGPLEEDEALLSAHLAKPYRAEIIRGFTELLEEAGIKRDRSKRIFIQITEALAGGQIMTDKIDRTLNRYGLSYQDLANAFANTASESGRILNELSQLDAIWRRLMRDEKAVTAQGGKGVSAKDIVPPAKYARLALDDLQASEVGKSAWRRAGDTIRKMILSDLSISIHNVLGTTLKLGVLGPEMVLKGVGLAVLNPTKYGKSMDEATGKLTPATGLSEAVRNSVKRELRAITEIGVGLSPKAMRQMLNRQGAKGVEQRTPYVQLLKELQVTHPELYNRLRGLSSGLETAGIALEDAIDNVRQVLPRIGDVKQRAKLEAELRTLEGRQKFNQSVAGRIWKGIDFPYDVINIPNMWQEMMLRPPFFAAALRAEAEVLGFNLDNLIQRQALDALPVSAIERAIDFSLEQTFAYGPHRRGEKEGVASGRDLEGWVEDKAAKLIDLLNSGGPITAAVGPAFARAVYNGMKVGYEYSMVGMLAPGSRLYSDMKKGRYDEETGLLKKGSDAIRADDIHRLAKGVMGTTLFFAALALRNSIGGDEWWQLKTGRKSKDGKPVYFNVQRFWPWSGFLWQADRVQRLMEGRTIDIKEEREFARLYMSYRGNDNGFSDIMGSVIDMFGGDEGAPAAKEAGMRAAGDVIAIPVTPFRMLRDLYGQWSEQEAERKELRGSGVWGPALDKLPWLRRDLPPAYSLTEEGPQSNSLMTAAAMAGGKFEARAFATQELARLGINPSRWLKRDMDLGVDQVQRRAFGMAMERLGQQLAESPIYQDADDVKKMMIWDFMVAKQLNLPALASKIALDANPAVKAAREVERKIDLPPIVEEKTGLKKKLREKVEEQKQK